MIFNMSGGGGGGELNFAIVGGLTQPTSPRENTIWVKTETSIPSWVFSPTVPTNPEAGMVFFKTALTSSVGFNALRKNEIAVLPTSAQQYVGGKWANVEAHVFIGGTWVQFSRETLYLYIDGDDCYALTGGWEAVKGTLTKGENAMTLAVSNNTTGYVRTVKAIDLTGIATMELLFDYSFTNTSSSKPNLASKAVVRMVSSTDEVIAATEVAGPVLGIGKTEEKKNVLAKVSIPQMDSPCYVDVCIMPKTGIYVKGTVTIRSMQLI